MGIFNKETSISKKVISTFIVSALIGGFIPFSNFNTGGVSAASISDSGMEIQFSQSCKKPHKFENAKIAVLSDTHYYAPELGTSGAAFDAYLAQDTKLLAESSAISKSAIDEIKESDAKIVLISGDLTKDGEKLSHQQFSKLLKKLEKAGKKVFVVPGNHDINNPSSSSYSGDKTIAVKNISQEQFKKIYKDFGYAEAISKDPNSLSYVVEPERGLRIIAMDSTKHNENAGKSAPETGGKFSDSTYNWIKQQVSEAKANGKTVIGFMHHGLLEHFDGQKQYFKDFVIDNGENVSEELADLGMEAVFTGHYHAQDITSKTTSAGNKIYDIETGSLVSYPCPYRIVDLTKNNLTVESKTIKSIDYDTDGVPFEEYSCNFLRTGLKASIPSMLSSLIRQMNPSVTQEQAYAAAVNTLNIQPAPSLTPMTINDLLIEARVQQYEGDEEANPIVSAISQGMLGSSDPMTQSLGFLLNSAYTDTGEEDNNTVLEFN
ncbi:metallophosphoesterase family protein [Acetivibrio cellulolyticus]|uniref:metallophosphoesterase family protein n=1 Tax=Acetivibrio cellulolyticus TaxID=35830 RepID=UPI0001E2F56C|nr:metallophosphoesterase [Acetivibrio cellulolyticus]